MALKDLLKKEISIKALLSKTKDDAIAYYDDSVEFVPAAPKSNVVPKELKEKYEAKDLFNSFRRLTLFIIVAFASAQLASFSYAQISNVIIDGYRNEAIGIQREIANLTPYVQYLEELEGKRGQAYRSAATDINIPEIMENILIAAEENGIQVTGIKFASNQFQAISVECTRYNEEAAAPIVGCIQLEGSTLDQNNIRNFENALWEYEGVFLEINKKSGSSAEGSNNFIASITVGSGSYSLRYDFLKYPIREMLLDETIGKPAEPQTNLDRLLGDN